MKGKTKKIILAVAVIGAIAAGGVAFTEANTVPDSVAGYKTTTVSGATVTDVQYTLSADGTQINDVILTFSDPGHHRTIAREDRLQRQRHDRLHRRFGDAGHLQRPHRGPRWRNRPRRGGHRDPVGPTPAQRWGTAGHSPGRPPRRPTYRSPPS